MDSLQYLTFLGLFLLLFVLAGCSSLRMSERQVHKYFERDGLAATQGVYTSGFRTIYYVSAGSDNLPTVLFVHGSPGSLTSFIHFLKDTVLTNRFRLVTVDRPGYGYSNYGNEETSLSKQATHLLPLLKLLKQHDQPLILAGHSFGGPLVARMAMDYPEYIDKLMIVAGALAPELEPNELWFRAPLASPFFGLILPPFFKVSNREIYKLKPQLHDMLPRWSSIQCPVLIIHGKQDNLVAFENVAFAKEKLINAPVESIEVANMNHYVPWTHPHLIRYGLLKLTGHYDDLTAMINDESSEMPK